MLECKPIILLNNNCNFKCCHCYVRPSDKQLSLEALNNFYESVIKPNNAKFIRFAGGEPFLYAHFHELALYLASLHEEDPELQFNITSNGSCLTDSIIEDLKIIKPNLVKVSLLTLREDKYKEINGIGFPIEKTLENIKKLNQHFDVGINMTIMKDTLSDVEPLIKFCLENDIHDLFFSQLTPAGRGFNISDQRLDSDQVLKVKELINSVDKSQIDIRYDDGCSCGFYQDFVLNWDGDVFPCTALVSYPEFKIGTCNSNVKDMRHKIKTLVPERKKVCFVEEFVTHQ